MSLTLYYHPFSSFCQKALIALYENETPFEKRLIDFGEAGDADELKKIWPIRKFPVLVDKARDRIVPEATAIIEHLSAHYPGEVKLIPEDPDLAVRARLSDRIFDNYVAAPMQKIVLDRIRPEGKRDPFGVEEARSVLATALGVIDKDLAGKTWSAGDGFTLADCAAAPALVYADTIIPLAGAYPNVAAYLARLKKRPSFERALAEAEPYWALFPKE